MNKQSPIEIYQTKDGQAQVELRLEQDTFWLSQKQMATLFDKDVRTINEHIQNIFKEGELDKNPTIRNFQIVRQEGQRKVKRNMQKMHITNIFKEGELPKEAVVANFATTATDGKTYQGQPQGIAPTGFN